MKLRLLVISIFAAPVVFALPANARMPGATAVGPLIPIPSRGATYVVGRAAANTNPATFTDPSNDAGTAPDIHTVIASNDANGTYRFRINVDKLTLPSNVVVGLGLDTDGNPATGNNGIDYVVLCDESNNSVQLVQWQSSQFRPVNAPTLSAADDAAGLTIAINRSDIGNTSAVNFFVGTADGSGGAGHEDSAPDNGVWNYQLTTASAVNLAVAGFAAPKTVVAGKSFLVAMLVTRSDTGEFVNDEIGGKVACVATFAGKRVPLIAAGFVETTSPEQAACLWRAPKRARHKTIRASITISVSGVKVTKTFAIRVR